MINIYKPTNTTYSNNGDAILIPTVCEIDITINGKWVLNLAHPYDAEERYKLIEEGAVLQIDADCIREITGRQRWRIYEAEKGLHAVTATAYPVAMEATFDAPVDNVIAKDKTGVQAMALLQAKTNKYTLSTDITAQKSSSWENTNINQAIGGSEAGSFVEVWGGEIVYNNLTFNVKSRIGQDNGYQIRYGRNMTDILRTIDDSGLVTRIYPISQDGIRLNGSGYVDSPLINQYPIIHSCFMMAPYNLVDTDAASPSRTAAQTQTSAQAITASASTTSQAAYSNAGNVPPEYIKSLQADIISAVQMQALAGVVSASLKNLFANCIAQGMDWIADLTQPVWEWHGDYTDGWWYGNNDGYAKSEYLRIGKTWSWFNAQGYWEEPADDTEEWDWYSPKDSSGWKYGNFKKYFAHNEFVYITRSGVLQKYWFNEDGWFEEDESGDSDWTWHGTGTEGDPYWFGEEGATAQDPKKYAHSVWLYIDGSLYYFDHEGTYTPGNKFDDYQWDWVEDDERPWFGNAEDYEFAAVYLKNQWAKIDGTWYHFDNNGYMDSQAEMRAAAIAIFTGGMTALTTAVGTQSTALYTLLYQLLTEYSNKQYTAGIDRPLETITVNMVDLSKTTEYQNFTDLETIKLGDGVTCIDDEHGISTESRVVGIVYDCIGQKNKEITIGSAAKTLSQIFSPGGGSPAGGFDTSAISEALTAQNNAIAALQTGKQDKLTAGTGIQITGQVISATGGAGLKYFKETQTALYGEQTLQTPEWSCLTGYYFDYQVTDQITPHTASPWKFEKDNSIPAIIVASYYTGYRGQSASSASGIILASKDPLGTNYTADTQEDPGRSHITMNGGYSTGNIALQEPTSSNMATTYTYKGETWYIAAFTINGVSGGASVRDNIQFNAFGYTFGGGQSLDDIIAALFAYVDPVNITKYYTGLHQGNNLAFFAGATDNNGANAKIKINNDGTTEGITKQMIGATDQEAGAAGYVPAPTTADTDKVLKGNGTWGTAGTEVEANPAETPTDTLTALGIAGTVYEIQGGGGGTDLLAPTPFIYSTSEEQVGVWTDGKPLYQKTYEFTLTSTNHALSLSGLNIDTFVEAQGFLRYQAGNDDQSVPYPYYAGATYYSAGYFNRNNQNYYVQSSSDSLTYYNKARITFKYTKTTDTAGSGGFKAYGFTPEIYSETEREIGVWTDGKPLYQKSWALTIPNQSGFLSFTNGMISDLDKVVKNSWSVRGQGQQTETPWYSAASLYFDAHNASEISFYASGTYLAGKIIYYTAQYTKTTDTPGSGQYTTLGTPAVHYSTDEQIIGTWIDGKPLYKKTLEYNNVSFSGSYNGFARCVIDFSGNMQNAKNIWVDMAASFLIEPYQGTDYFRSFDFWEAETNTAGSETNIILFRRSTYSGVNLKLTVTYTKTTD